MNYQDILKHKSKHTWSDWLASVIRYRKTPSGRNLKREIYVVPAGDEIDVAIGWQTFGSGCYAANWVWRAKDDAIIPEVRRKPDSDSESQFCVNQAYAVTIPTDCLVLRSWSDVFRSEAVVFFAVSDQRLARMLKLAEESDWYFFQGDPIEALETPEGRAAIDKYLAEMLDVSV